MDEIDIVEKLLESNLSEVGLVLAFIATFILRPLWKRVDSFGERLDLFLAASNGRVAASTLLAKEIRKLAKSMPKRADDAIVTTKKSSPSSS